MIVCILGKKAAFLRDAAHAKLSTWKIEGRVEVGELLLNIT